MHPFANTTMWRTDYSELKRISKDTNELWVRGPKIKDLNFLKEFSQIKRLFLSSIKTDDLLPIAFLKQLTHLQLTNIGNGSSLEVISELQNLEELVLQTPTGWDGSGKVVKYLSLEPISRLPKLKELTLLDVVFENDGLEPLIKSKTLSTLTTSNKFSTKDFAKLSKYKPELNFRYAQAYTTWEGFEFYRCNKCGRMRVEFCGVDLKRRVFCLNCNKKKVEELINRYNDIKNDA